MKPLPVQFTAQALQDLDGIFFILLELGASVATAERYVRRLKDRAVSIGELPHGGSPRDGILEGLRIVPHQRRAVIAYLVQDETVIVTNVFYGGEDYQAILRGERPDRWRPD